MPGKGDLILTGQLGEVMRESAQAALSFARSRAADSASRSATYEKQDIHIHVPAGGVPKDGPSAGITIATALISALASGRCNRHVAMTGEITLRGRVLPVGGIKEKVLAAHRAGIKTFVLPKKNQKDLAEVPEGVRRSLQFVYAEEMYDVLRAAFPDWSMAVLRPTSRLGSLSPGRAYGAHAVRQQKAPVVRRPRAAGARPTTVPIPPA